MPIIGLDIGGANLKASDGQSQSMSRRFAIWQEPQRLADELRLLLGEFDFSPSPPPGNSAFTPDPHCGGEGRGEGRNVNPSPQPSPPLEHKTDLESLQRGRGSERHSSLKPQAPSLLPLAVTMTAELADCFATKAEGVAFILDAVRQVAGGREVLVWQTGGEFVSPEEAVELVPLVAAANWHALATWAARLTAGSENDAALLIDLGSTTCDIIPLVAGLPMSTGRTDVERLRSGELVYTGVRRTPLVAVCHSVPFRDGIVPLAAELFATMLDVYLLLGETAEDFGDTNTANGKPATIEAAWDRIARSVCCDRNECCLEEAQRIAIHIRSQHYLQISSAIARVTSSMPQPPSQIVLSGEGEPVVRRLIESMDWPPPTCRPPQQLSLREMLGPAHSSAACAYALARLAAERVSA